MAKMIEVKRSKASIKIAPQSTVTTIEINGQIVKMTVCKPVPAPKGLTARGK